MWDWLGWDTGGAHREYISHIWRSMSAPALSTMHRFCLLALVCALCVLSANCYPNMGTRLQEKARVLANKDFEGKLRTSINEITNDINNAGKSQLEASKTLFKKSSDLVSKRIDVFIDKVHKLVPNIQDSKFDTLKSCVSDNANEMNKLVAAFSQQQAEAKPYFTNAPNTFKSCKSGNDCVANNLSIVNKKGEEVKNKLTAEATKTANTITDLKYAMDLCTTFGSAEAILAINRW